MYLIDKEIYEVLPELNVETENPAYPFSAEQQVQPCSIDLRLSNVFWQAVSKSSIIDLRRSKLAEVSPRRHWRRVALKPHESHTIGPGQIMLGRTYEKFSMPNHCAGKIEGRSSFSRMGLGVHCTGDFINPGWRGHMPLQLVNKGPYPIKVFPFLPLCQLILIKLSDVPEHLYGTDRLQSKYMDDDGGPSYWWRDNRIKQLQQALNQQDITLAVQQEILQTIGVQEPEVLERFEKYVDRRPIASLESAEALLDRFAQGEEHKRILDRIYKWAHAVPLALTGSLSIKLMLEPPFGLKHYIVWSITLLSLAVAARGLAIKDLDYLGEKELRQLRLSSGKESNSLKNS